MAWIHIYWLSTVAGNRGKPLGICHKFYLGAMNRLMFKLKYLTLVCCTWLDDYFIFNQRETSYSSGLLQTISVLFIIMFFHYFSMLQNLSTCFTAEHCMSVHCKACQHVLLWLLNACILYNLLASFPTEWIQVFQPQPGLRRVTPFAFSTRLLSNSQ